jgi:hypothetical protein
MSLHATARFASRGAVQRHLSGPIPHPPECTYELRAAVLCGSELSFDGASIGSDGERFFEAVVENVKFATEKMKTRTSYASFLLPDGDEGGLSRGGAGIFRKINEHEPITLPAEKALRT